MRRGVLPASLSMLAAAGVFRPDAAAGVPGAPARVAGATCAAPTFGSPVGYPVPSVAGPLLTADLNGDGRLDLATVGWSGPPGWVKVLLADETGRFLAAPPLNVPGQPSGAIVTLDFNDDGHADLAVGMVEFTMLPDGTERWTGSIALFPGDGSGRFGAATVFESGQLPSAVLAADFDLDGRSDLAIADGGLTDRGVAILSGGTGGTLALRQRVPLAHWPSSLAIGDLDADGRRDLVVATVDDSFPPDGGPQTLDGALVVLRAEGGGTFAPQPPIAAGTQPFQVVLGDFNADGTLDAATAEGGVPDGEGGSREKGVSVLLGLGDGRLGPPMHTELEESVRAAAVGDLDGDGRHDLLLSTTRVNGQSVLQVFLQTATGLASPVLVELFDHEAGAVVIGDFDQDGRNDLAVQSNLSSWDEYEVAVLPNLCGNTADISVAVSHAPEPLGGRELTYTVEVTNNGPDASGVRVLVTLPPEMYLAARTPGCSDRHPIVHCILDNLSGVPPANVASVVLRIATPADGGTFRFATTAVASVPDPDASNDSAEQSVTVLRIGGRGLALTSSDAGVTLTWDGGNAQAGYVVGRAVEGTATFFPSDGGWLPADATEFTDPAPVQGRGNCYMLAPMHATGTGIGTSDLLCVAPGTGLGGVPSAISIRIWRDVVGLSWADVPGTFKLVYKYDPETGESRQVFQTPEASAAFWKEGKVCYAVAFRVGPSYLGYSDLVCAVPMSTLPPP